jgi:methionine-rich copper-binding protein CopC/uncharacterized membrane protein
MRRLCLYISVLITLFALTVPPAAAHGYIVRAIPEDRAVLERAPLRVQYWFSESLEAAFSTITIRDPAGTEIASGGVDARDPRLLAARLPVGLPDGAYAVDLRIAFASDGHVIAERRAFFVGQAGAFAEAAAAAGAVPLEVVWRALVLLGTTLLFGALGAYRLVFLPAWGSAVHPMGNLPPRVMRRLAPIMIAAWIAALIGSIIALLQQAMIYFDADLGRVLSENLWSIVRTSTRFGDTWNARMALLGLIGALLAFAWYVRASQPALVRPFLSACLWGMPPLILTWSAAAHAAGSPILPWAALFSDWLHGIGVGLWAGGVAALALILPAAAAPYSGDERAAVIRPAIRRFTPVALACVGVVIATGVYNAANWIAAPSDLALPYGVTLILKAAMIAPLLALGYIQWRGRFTPTAIRIEMIAAAAVVIAAAFLSATPVPPIEIAGRDQPAPTANARIGALDAMVTIAPGGPGVNTIDVALTRDGAPIEAESVRLQLAHPASDVRGAPLDAEPLGQGVYTAAGDELDRAGTWWLIADVDGAQTALAFEIRADAAVALTRDPSVVNLIALVFVSAALVRAAYPSARRFVRWLDWNPGAITAAGAAIAACIVVVIFGVIASNEAAAQLDAQLNPPPAIVNSILPDAESLARGQTIFAESCGWAGATLAELRRRLDRARDETLYAAVRDGWRDLPACRIALDTDAARWDVVNWIRWGMD